MATNPKYPLPPEPRRQPEPGPRLVRVHPASPPRSFKLFMIGVALLVAAVVIFLAIWLLTFGGGNQQQQSPHPGGNGTPSGTPTTQFIPPSPRIQPTRPPLYAWAK